MADLNNTLWDDVPVKKGSTQKQSEHTGAQIRRRGTTAIVEGKSAFGIWRSLYFSKLLSGRNQAQVCADWGFTTLFGRDISNPRVVRVKEDGEAK